MNGPYKLDCLFVAGFFGLFSFCWQDPRVEHLKEQAPALLVNIRQGRKSLPGASTVAYAAQSYVLKKMKCCEYSFWHRYPRKVDCSNYISCKNIQLEEQALLAGKAQLPCRPACFALCLLLALVLQSWLFWQPLKDHLHWWSLLA